MIPSDKIIWQKGNIRLVIDKDGNYIRQNITKGTRTITSDQYFENLGVSNTLSVSGDIFVDGKSVNSLFSSGSPIVSGDISVTNIEVQHNITVGNDVIVNDQSVNQLFNTVQTLSTTVSNIDLTPATPTISGDINVTNIGVSNTVDVGNDVFINGYSVYSAIQKANAAWNGWKYGGVINSGEDQRIVSITPEDHKIYYVNLSGAFHYTFSLPLVFSTGDAITVFRIAVNVQNTGGNGLVQFTPCIYEANGQASTSNYFPATTTARCTMYQFEWVPELTKYICRKVYIKPLIPNSAFK